MKTKKDVDPKVKHFMLVLGNTVRRKRSLKSLTQRQLSLLTGVPQTTISDIENGRHASIPALFTIADFVRMPLSKMFKETEKTAANVCEKDLIQQSNLLDKFGKILNEYG